jgi:hypothetical protein
MRLPNRIRCRVPGIDPTIPGQFLVYAVKCLTTGRHYVGVIHGKRQTVGRRWRDHCRATHPTYFEQAIHEHGIGNFQVMIVAKAETIAELERLEQHFVRRFDSYQNGYNRSLGGKLFPPELSRARWRDPAYWTKMRKAQSEGTKKHWQDSAYRAFMQDVNRCNWQRPELRAKMLAVCKANGQWIKNRQRLKEQNKDPEFRKRRSVALKRQLQDPTFRERSIASLKRRWQDPEFRNRMSRQGR